MLSAICLMVGVSLGSSIASDNEIKKATHFEPYIYQANPIETPERLYLKPLASIGNGQCTALVKYYTEVPFIGNANTYLSQAKDSGYEVGNIPKIGSIWVANSKPYGHVALVIKVNENSFRVLEQNQKGWGIVSEREIPFKNNLWFIYL